MHKQNTRKQQLNRGKKTSTKNSRRKGPGPKSAREFTLVVPRSVSTIIPDRLVTTLRWWKSVPINLSAVSFAAVRFSPTSAFDPDPVGSSLPAGFTTLAGLYNSYRVKRSTATAETVNTGDVPITTTLFPSNTDPGASPVSAYVVASRLQSYATSITGALKGGPLARLSTSMSTQKMYGNKMTDYDDSFAALVNTVPLNNWWWVISFYSLAVAPNAAVLNFYMDMEIEFYDRANQLQ